MPKCSVLKQLPRQSTVDIQFENVSYTVPDGQKGIRNITRVHLTYVSDSI